MQSVNHEGAERATRWARLLKIRGIAPSGRSTTYEWDSYNQLVAAAERGEFEVPSDEAIDTEARELLKKGRVHPECEHNFLKLGVVFKSAFGCLVCGARITCGMLFGGISIVNSLMMKRR